MSLEQEIKKLRDELNALTHRVRLDTVAEQFIAGDHTIRVGDYVRFSDSHAAHIYNISSEGKWTYLDRHGRNVEPFRVPPEDNIERLYTINEVAEIIAKTSSRHASVETSYRKTIAILRDQVAELRKGTL